MPEITIDEKLRLNEAIRVLRECCQTHTCKTGCPLNGGVVCNWGRGIPLKSPAAWREIEIAGTIEEGKA